MLPIAVLDAAIEARQTNRGPFTGARVPDDVVRELVEAATAEGAEAFPITREEHRLAAARLGEQADRLANADPGYRAELRAWTGGDLGRLDGVPTLAVPRPAAGDDRPTGDGETRATGWLPDVPASRMNGSLLLLGALRDEPTDWLRVGEALQRVLLEITRHGYVASPLTPVIEVARTNELLRHELGLTMYPHVLLRSGRAAVTSRTRRRRLVDVISESP